MMKDGYVKNHPNKTTFSLREIITQVMPENTSQTTENYYRHKIRIIQPILKVLGVDINLYKTSSNKYKIPALLAELVYVLAVEAEKDSSQTSNLSCIKYEELDKISVDDKIDIITNFFDEISKDFPKLKEICDYNKQMFLCSYRYYISVDLAIDKLNSIKNKIGLPLIAFDYESMNSKLEEYDKCLENNLIKVTYKNGEIETLKKPNSENTPVFNEISKCLFGIKGTTNFLPYLQEMFDCLDKLSEEIENLQKVFSYITE